MRLAAMRICTLTVLLAACEPAAQLPPDIMVDRYLLQAERAVREWDYASARAAMERLEELEQGRGMELKGEDYYRYAQVWEAVGEQERAMAAAVRYLKLQGREAEHYTKALELINRVEARVKAAKAASEESRKRAESAIAGMEFVWYPPGEFLMGSTGSEADDDEQPLTRVRISRGFWLGKYEVTQGQWQAVMGSNPSLIDGCGADCPVERVSWDDVQEFIGRLNEKAGGQRYRLPTEAEWEYAARGGTTGDRYGNLDAIAWYDGNSGSRTHPVGQKAPNAWGLYDMLGNVFEWVQDWKGDYPGGNVTDPQGPRSGSFRVIRGGSFGIGAEFCRASGRSGFSPSDHDVNIGFRLLRVD